jgi:hypothetical protein
MNRIRDGYERRFGEDFERFPQFRDLPQPTSAFKGRGAAAQPPGAQPAGAAPARPAQGGRREIAPGVFVTERP